MIRKLMASAAIVAVAALGASAQTYVVEGKKGEDHADEGQRAGDRARNDGAPQAEDIVDHESTLPSVRLKRGGRQHAWSHDLTFAHSSRGKTGRIVRRSSDTSIMWPTRPESDPDDCS